MSWENFLKDIATGNFTNAGKRIEDEVTTLLPPPIARIVNFVLSEGYKIVGPVVVTVGEGLLAKGLGNLTTADFVAGAKTIVSQSEAQGITVLEQDAFTLLNAHVAAGVATISQAAAPALTDDVSPAA